MVMTTSSCKNAEELIMELAKAGLRNHIRPICSDTTGIDCRLFDLDVECERKSRALDMLETAYKATAISDLGPTDARIYRREHERRVKQLNAMLEDRSKLLAHYGHELAESPLRHPALKEHYEALSI
ncbi:MAG: hypothetical protein ACI97A_001886 [Planctomycetota bacterium]|jgi:hypothetical protein